MSNESSASNDFGNSNEANSIDLKNRQSLSIWTSLSRYLGLSIDPNMPNNLDELNTSNELSDAS